jgi:hypothetical protein
MARAGVAIAQLAKERTRQETILRVYQAHTALLLARESIGILGEAWSVLRDAKRSIEKELGEGDDADPDAINPDRDPADLLRVELGELELQGRMNAARKIESVALATLWTLAGDAAPPGFDVAERALEADSVAGGLKPVDHYRDLGLQARPEAKMAAGLVDLRKAGEKFARSQSSRTSASSSPPRWRIRRAQTPRCGPSLQRPLQLLAPGRGPRAQLDPRLPQPGLRAQEGPRRAPRGRGPA